MAKNNDTVSTQDTNANHGATNRDGERTEANLGSVKEAGGVLLSLLIASKL